MIIQWVASGQGVGALPSWALARSQAQVTLCPLGRHGLWADLHALRRSSDRDSAALDAFVAVVRRESFRALDGISPVPGGSGTDRRPARVRRRRP